MHYRLKTRCRFPGCPELVRGFRFCDDHRKFAYRQQDDRRLTAAARGYDHAWAKVADQRREMDCFLCQPCLKRHRLTPAKIVDHIVPVHIRPDWRLELGNTQVICNLCHQQKTAEDSNQFGSSTTTSLTDKQLTARQLAQEGDEPPRALDEG